MKRVHKFEHSFCAASFHGEVEDSRICITEEYVAACLKPDNPTSLDVALDGERNIHQVSKKSLVEFSKYVEESFEGESKAQVSCKSWKKSLLHGRCKDIVNFLQEQMSWTTDDVEFVDDVVVQAALGIMRRKQFGWTKFLSSVEQYRIVQW